MILEHLLGAHFLRFYQLQSIAIEALCSLQLFQKAVSETISWNYDYYDSYHNVRLESTFFSHCLINSIFETAVRGHIFSLFCQF